MNNELIMMRTTFSILILFGLLFLAARPAAAQSERQEIRQMLEQRDRQIKDVLGTRETFSDAQRDRLKELINDAIDFEAMGRVALGPHWNDISAAQQREFVSVFSDVVRAQSLSNLDIYRSSVRYDNIAVNGANATVTTTTTYKETDMNVVYDLQKKDGDWHVTDIVLDGTSTAQGYATSFQRVFKRHGFDRLMDSLRKRAERS